MDKLKIGDYVKIPIDYSTGFTCEGGKSKPWISEYAGKEAIVIEGGGSCGMFIKGHGKVWWFDADSMEFIEHNRCDLLSQWEDVHNREIQQASDLDWIFANGERVLQGCQGATASSLGKCLGVDNMWGSHGEGFVFHQNAMMILNIAEPFLKKGDKKGWLEFCKAASQKNNIESVEQNTTAQGVSFEKQNDSR